MIRYIVDRHGKDTLALSPTTRRLAELRYQIRRFLHFSEQAARKMGLEPQQHQFMLALKGLPAGLRPTIGDPGGANADPAPQHRRTREPAFRAGLVRRSRAGEDRRQVLLTLTPKGEKMLRELSMGHKAELRTQGPALVAALERAMRPTKSAQRVCPRTPSRQFGEAG